MSTQVQLRRGTTAQHATFTGAPGEVTVDTTENMLRVHDGSTVGGFPADYAANVKRFGAKGDGATDDAPAIDRAVQWAAANGVGTVFIPAGTYMLGTISAVSGSIYSYIVPQNNVSIIGEGMGATTLKVMSGQNALFPSTDAPRVIATNQTNPLTGCRFADFTVDWNGANNLLSAGNLQRSNSSIFSEKGGTRITCERLRIITTPGNQCIFFPATSNNGQGDIVVRDCYFEQSGSGLAGNYNIDHSSVYLNGQRCRIEDCSFINPQMQNGAAFELHGSDSTARGNYGIFVERGFWVVSNYETTANVTVSDCYFDKTRFSFDYSAGTFPVNNLTVRGCFFSQYSAASYSSGQSYIAANCPTVTSTKLILDGNTFIGNAIANCRMMLIDYINDVFIVGGNRFSGFQDLGIWAGGHDLGTGRCIENFVMQGNLFDQVTKPVIMAAATGIGTMLIEGNTFAQTATTGTAAIEFDSITSGTGRISNNNIDYTKYNSGTGGIVLSAGLASVVVDQARFGTWSVKVGSTQQTPTTGNGQWTKVGNMVFFNIYCDWTGLTATGNVQLTLPASGPAAYGGSQLITLLSVAVTSIGLSYTANTSLTGLIVTGGPYVQIYTQTGSSTAPAAMQTAGTLYVSGSYQTVAG
jgi:hypothetical protein